MVVAREKKIRFQDGTNLATATRLLTQYSGAGISAMELETSGGETVDAMDVAERVSHFCCGDDR